MAHWEPDGPRVGGQIVEPQRRGVADEDAEDPAPTRRFADPCPSRPVDAVGDEPLQMSARCVDHTEGRVTGFGELGCSLGEPVEYRVERQLGRERHPGLEERAQATVDEAPRHPRLRPRLSCER